MNEIFTYNLVAVVFYFVVMVAPVCLILVHDLGVNALAFIFDTEDVYEARWAFKLGRADNILDKIGGDDESGIWLYLVFGNLLIGIFLAMVWPLTLSVAMLIGAMVVLRRIVRGTKSKIQEGLDQHVVEMHQ